MHCLIMNGKGGVSAATAEVMAKAGYSVSLMGQQTEEDLRVARKIVAEGGRAVALQGDVCNYVDIEQVFDEAEESLGRLCVVVNAAEIPNGSSFEGRGLEKLSQLAAANVIGFLFCCREASRRMALSSGGRGGAIINITAPDVYDGNGHVVSDCTTSKSAIDTFTTDFARRVAVEGIRVATVRLADFTAVKAGSLPSENRAMVEGPRSLNQPIQLEQIAETVLALVHG